MIPEESALEERHIEEAFLVGWRAKQKTVGFSERTWFPGTTVNVRGVKWSRYCCGTVPNKMTRHVPLVVKSDAASKNFKITESDRSDTLQKTMSHSFPVLWTGAMSMKVSLSVQPDWRYGFRETGVAG